jgi:molybdenum cofactor biosynthesis enzyme MoaA
MSAAVATLCPPAACSSDRGASESLWHVTVLSNFARGYDKYSGCYSKRAIPESTFPDRFFLLPPDEIDIGARKARRLLDRLDIPGNRLLAMRTTVPAADLHENTRTGIGRYVARDFMRVDRLAWLDADDPEGNLVPVTTEEAMALSLRLLRPTLLSYEELRPRTFSILPIARGCQARCPFCFSTASASAEQEQARLDVAHVRRWADLARSRGAERFVITGGGEPGLVPHRQLLDFLAIGRETLGKTVLITNGHHLARCDQAKLVGTLADYHDAGLGVLAVSRHHHDGEINSRLMSLDTDAAAVSDVWRDNRSRWPNLRLRFICVLQQGGVENSSSLQAYVNWAAALGVEELCFKELYVSTSVESVYHQRAANAWSRAHHVPLALVLDFAAQHGLEEASRLPWGAPVFRGTWNGRPLSIAAYTEPSLFWERTQGIARSWNLMADGRCLVSLEDRESCIEPEDIA